MDMRVYIVNASRYAEGESIGAWFTPPINIDEVKEEIGLTDECGDYFIHQYDLPFDISEYTSIEEINHLCSLVKQLEGTPVESEIRAIQETFFGSLQEMVEHIGDIKYYPYDNMKEVARYLILETNECGEIPIALRDYIDYEKYGRDLELNSGNFLVTSHGIFEYTGK